MPMPTMNQNSIKYLHDKAVRQLVAAHRQRTDDPLVLAVRYKLDDPSGDIHLLEVLDGFPGGDEDELLVTEFGPSANLIIVGRLHLVLGSPAQVRSALERGNPIMKAVQCGKVVFDDGGAEAARLRKAAGQ